MFTYNTWVVLIGTGLLGANAGLVGAFAVLRRRALVGDALAHAALPGVCLAFWITGARDPATLAVGALVGGLLGVGVVAGLRRLTPIKEDAAIGIVLSVFFGAGIALSRAIQGRPGLGNRAGLDSYLLGKTAGILAADAALAGAVAAASLLIVVLLYKELRLVSFDPDFAGVQGWPVVVLDLAILGLVAAAVVIGLPAVGVVLTAALLILPGAAARLWTESLGRLLALAAGFGLGVGVIGTLLSARYGGLPAGPIIVLVGSAGFVLSLLFAPRRGVVARALARHRDRAELAGRAVLLDLQRRGGTGATADDLREGWAWAGLDPVAMADRAGRDGLIERLVDGRIVLTEAGRARAIAMEPGPGDRS